MDPVALLIGSFSQWLFARKSIPDWVILGGLLVASCWGYVASVGPVALAHGWWGVWQGGLSYMSQVALGQMVTSKIANSLVSAGAANAGHSLIPVSNSKP